jgi:hypothetical protein
MNLFRLFPCDIKRFHSDSHSISTGPAGSQVACVCRLSGEAVSHIGRHTVMRITACSVPLFTLHVWKERGRIKHKINIGPPADTGKLILDNKRQAVKLQLITKAVIKQK